ncbi:MAG: LytTR family DNA-binding domain-containing protein [Zoogloeaceae bacterium]|jgi:two-component system response regulator AlgR|nr:LytTR family DNA-binding domain-containing protein [Zoogloeaceae bacterium]
MTTLVPLNLLIVDDEALARQRLRELLADIALSCPTEVLAEAENGQVALDWLQAGHEKVPDALLVDIHMPRMDGLELAGRLNFLSPAPAIIFTTAYDNHAVQAFDLNVVDYLLKPVRVQRLLAALEKVRQRSAAPLPAAVTGSEGGRSHLHCHERNRLLLVPITEILYFKADLKYVVARTREREYVLNETLAGLEEEFPNEFIRLHRSVLVARSALSGFERAGEEEEAYGYALLRYVPEKLPISRRQWSLARSAASAEGNGSADEN